VQKEDLLGKETYEPDRPAAYSPIRRLTPVRTRGLPRSTLTQDRRLNGSLNGKAIAKQKNITAFK
jgi:hypothetical protein